MFFSRSKRPSSSLPKKGTRNSRPAAEQLEDRTVPAPLTFVNDNWHLFLDADASGTLTVNDVVTNGNDPGSGPLTGYLYGVQAFGTVTSGPFVGPGSLPAFDSINEAIA